MTAAVNGFFQTLADTFRYIWNQILSMSFSDVLDIIIVSVLVFYVYGFVRQRRAGKLALGILAVLVVTWISDVVGMGALNYILEKLFDVGLVALIVIFQPELRSALEKMGGNFRNLKNIAESREKDGEKVVDEICSAVSDLSESRTGALIVLERSTRLGDEIKTGVEVNADVNSFLIKNIFYNKAPLHDGAMIIRDGRIHSCGCFLPLTGNPDLPKEYGTRHRAGLGISEISDAFVIIVSEETGDISIARNGEIDKGVPAKVLRHRLINELGLDRTRKKKNRKGGARREVERDAE